MLAYTKKFRKFRQFIYNTFNRTVKFGRFIKVFEVSASLVYFKRATLSAVYFRLVVLLI